MYRRVPAGEMGRVVITPQRTSEKLIYRPVEAQTAPRPAAIGDPAWYATSNGRQWRYIVIHHSATAGGNAQQFDVAHRQVRGFDELGYHFVIDNGNGGPDGRVEVGSRWGKQKHGAHTGGTPDKPVGTVHIATAAGANICHARHVFAYGRRGMRERTAHAALNQLWRQLLEQG